MVYIVSEYTCPHGTSADLGKKWFEALKKYPPDSSIGKTLKVLVRSTSECVKVIGIGKPKPEKIKEFIKSRYRMGEVFTTIPGLNYEIKIYLDYTEAFEVLDMEPPKEI